ncbi:rhodanese-like domain-containing protein [Chthonobacter albigriseus]|uniref:rhodanese-like domain-containing protein n=1 Tax=Chthonobacter albigriseus TaxID=1683161 RepID=UPI0015EE85A9|nr:rhodanese-like domain-containing protein [Chthonobacter albigriseus]
MFGFSRPAAKTVSPEEARSLAESGAIRLVDVREAGEWAQGRIAGAIHAPLSRLRDLAGTLPSDKPVVFYCLSGARSGQAVALAKALGLPHDTHMAGGISAWRAHGFPLTR